MGEGNKRTTKKSDADYKLLWRGNRAQGIEGLKHFVDFKIDLRKKLSKSDKAKITKYANAIDRLTARPNYLYTPRSKKRLKIAQLYSHTDPRSARLPHLKVAFVPVPEEGDKPIIRFTQHGLEIKSYYVKSHFLPFNPKKLAKNPKKEVAAVIARDPDAEKFSVKTGDFQMADLQSRDSVAEEVERLMLKYNNEEANNHYGNWLVGLVSHQFINQDTEDEYIIATRKAKTKKKVEHKKRAYARKKSKKQEEEQAAKVALEKALNQLKRENARLKKQLSKTKK